MELEIVRACAAGAAHSTIGLNAMIDGLVLDTIGDERPSHVAFYNYVDHPWVARKAINREEAENGKVVFPALAIYLEAAPVLQPEVRTVYRDGDFAVAFSHLTIEPDQAKAMREALYANRAMLRFLTRFNSDADPGKSLRFRNNVNVYVAKALTQYTPFELWGDVLLAATTLVTYQCREHLP